MLGTLSEDSCQLTILTGKLCRLTIFQLTILTVDILSVDLSSDLSVDLSVDFSVDNFAF